ncbi:hypothetical protein SLEP1_g58115 [Rubroshorea leprosula]|uniref:Uncharacterized protein n=1 Tax=Rubroshorea leprosula TaxID=152421 RepID=A0AAV5MNI7_9ROSI|nr:hypothetical protein SLEP1_g58115 [Rubroshorea leprosula]
MIKCWHFFSQGIRWTPNDGKSINFLFDDCLPSGPLSTAIHGPHSLQDYFLLVADATPSSPPSVSCTSSSLHYLTEPSKPPFYYLAKIPQTPFIGNSPLMEAFP